MKRLIIGIPVVLFCAFAACKKAKGPPNSVSVTPDNNRDSTVHMSASINGAGWETDSAFGYKVKFSGNDTAVSNLMIIATRYIDGDITTIKFDISRFEGPKVYQLNPPVNAAYYYDANNIRHIATSGSLSVDTDTAYALRGTFSFTADTVSVANGKFDVALP